MSGLLTQISGGRKKVDGPVKQSVGSPIIEAWQKYLKSVGYLRAEPKSGVYDNATHEATQLFAKAMMGQVENGVDPVSTEIKYLHGRSLEDLYKDQSLQKKLAIILHGMQAQRPSSKSRAELLKNTPYYDVTVGGKPYTLPLALIRSYGYPMYQTILDQNDLLDPHNPSVADKERQLDEVLRAFVVAYPPDNPENTNILFLVTKADADLRAMWNSGLKGESQDGSLLVERLGLEIPEFRRASNAQKLEIVQLIAARMPRPEEIMTLPAGLNSQITSREAFDRRLSSIGYLVKDRMRQMGIIQ